MTTKEWTETGANALTNRNGQSIARNIRTGMWDMFDQSGRCMDSYINVSQAKLACSRSAGFLVL